MEQKKIIVGGCATENKKTKEFPSLSNKREFHT
jgi:hypothetical protein